MTRFPTELRPAPTCPNAPLGRRTDPSTTVKSRFFLSTWIALFTAPALNAAPNILLIIADDMGLDASHCYAIGTQQAPMPNIEALCDQGLVFENAYAAPTCSPTRSMIMTGQYAFRTGVGGPVSPNGRDELNPDTPTLFDALTSAGYASNVIGKWHLSGWRAEGTGYSAPAKMGVSDYFGLFHGSMRDYSQWTAIENEREVQITGYSTSVFTDHAIDWIGAQDAPWFLWLAYNAPHDPFHRPPNDLHRFDDLPNTAAAIRRNPLPYYQAMLEAMDTEIGRLLGSMSPAERANTIVMFIGDNGSPNQVTRGFYGGHAAKGTIYDSGTRVPLIVAGPGVQPGRSTAFVNATDLNATIAELAGAQTSAPDAISFAPVLSGNEGDRDFIMTEHFSRSQGRGRGVYGWSMREGDYKLIAPEGGAPELYDLARDPLEQVNLLSTGANEAALAAFEAMKARRASLLAQGG